MNYYLIFAGIFSTSAALIHVGCIYFGASWYRFFGAGEQMAIWAEQGNIKSTIITSGITLVLSIWSAYAFSAAGLIIKLPLVKLAMIAITTIYLVRGVGGLFLMSNPMGRSPEFWLWSSLICLVIGLCHFLGLKQVWTSI
ncbi:MAG: hypothetical protein COA86_17150 [Kangiella sp.]|nr:MAG: hypothetical protein COA86_17150 [Kangiella sp.]